MSPRRRVGVLALLLAASCGSTLEVPLPAPDHAELVLGVQPDSAEVYLDGVRVGTATEFDGTAGVLALVPGRHVVMLRKAGYATYRGAVRARAGRREVLRVILERVGD